MIGYQLGQQGYPAEAISAFNIDNPVIYSAVERLRYSMVEADSLRSLIFIVASAMIMWAATSKFIKNWMAIAAISVLILSDLYTADKRYLNHDSFCTPALSTADPFPLSANDKAILLIRLYITGLWIYQGSIILLLPIITKQSGGIMRQNLHDIRI